MAELVDAPASGAGARKGVEVRVLFWAPFFAGRVRGPPPPAPERRSAPAQAEDKRPFPAAADALNITAGFGGLALQLGQMQGDQEVRVAVAVPGVPAAVRSIRNVGFPAIFDHLPERAQSASRPAPRGCLTAFRSSCASAAVAAPVCAAVQSGFSTSCDDVSAGFEQAAASAQAGTRLRRRRLTGSAWSPRVDAAHQIPVPALHHVHCRLASAKAAVRQDVIVCDPNGIGIQRRHPPHPQRPAE